MRSKLLLLIALRRSGGGVEGLGGSGERKKGSPLPLIPIPRGTKVQPIIIKKQKIYIPYIIRRKILIFDFFKRILGHLPDDSSLHIRKNNNRGF